MRKSLLIAASTAALLSLPAAAFAAEPMPAEPAAPTQTLDSTTMPEAPAAMQEDATANPLAGMDLSTLIDAQVYDAAGQSLGDVNDIALNEDGDADALIIGTGGVLGFAERDVKVDVEDVVVEQGDSGPSLALKTMTSEDVAGLPTYEADENAKTFNTSDDSDTAPDSSTPY